MSRKGRSVVSWCLWLLPVVGLAILFSCSNDPDGSKADAGAHDAHAAEALAHDTGLPDEATQNDAPAQTDSGSDVAIGHDAACTPGASATGLVTITSGLADVNGITELAAVFYPSAARYAADCAIDHVGDHCDVVRCPGDPRPVLPPYQNPGTLSVSGGASSVTAEPTADGDYAYSASGRLWIGGERLKVSAPGLDTEYPAGREVTAPSPDFSLSTYLGDIVELNLGQDLALSWAPPSLQSAEIRFELKQSPAGGGMTAIECAFPSAVLTGSIPRAALAALDPDVEGVFNAFASRATQQTRPGPCGERSTFRFALQSWLRATAGYTRDVPVQVMQGTWCTAPRLVTLEPQTPNGDLAGHDGVYFVSASAPIEVPATLCEPALEVSRGLFYAFDLPEGQAYDVTIEVQTNGYEDTATTIYRSSPWDAHAALISADCQAAGACGTTAGGTTMLTSNGATGRVIFFVQELPSTGNEFLSVFVWALPSS
jgi:hypothetical protein